MRDVTGQQASRRWVVEPALPAGASRQSPALAVMRLDVMLVLGRGGEVLNWIGPALRGIIAARLKALVCRYDARERSHRWQHCAGCPHIQECAYGCLYEPDPPSVSGYRGQTGATRPVVVAPFFPIERRVAAGDVIGLRITLIGDRAVRCMPHVITALTSCGRNPGLGPDRITLDVRRPSTPPERCALHSRDLPATLTACGGTLPRLTIVLNAPLLLAKRDRDGVRRSIAQPTCGDLFRASSRMLSALFAEEGTPLMANFGALTAAAERVRCREDHFERFGQRRWSTRTEQRFHVQGATGGAVYENVPLALLPWLLWGGRLHVGTHRVAGAGGWRIVLD